MSDINESAGLCRAVLSHINAWEGRCCDAALETLDTRAGGLMLRPVTGAARIKEYVDGSYIGAMDFALTVRLKAIDALFDIGKMLETAQLPELGEGYAAEGISMLSTPRITQRGEDGSEDYTASYRLRYSARQN